MNSMPFSAGCASSSRWALMRNTSPENVQEHSHQVAVLAHALALIRRDILAASFPGPGKMRRGRPLS